MMDANLTWTCDGNSGVGGETVNTTENPRGNSKANPKGFYWTMGSLFVGSMLAAFAPTLLPTAASNACADGDCTNEVNAVTNVASRTKAVAQRTQQLIDGQPGYNVSPESWFNQFDKLGRAGTYVTDKKALTDVLGQFSMRGNTMTVTVQQVNQLEKALGLYQNTLTSGFRISRISNIAARNPVKPTFGNEFFLGVGKGLPGGGPELVINPISSQGGAGINQIIVKVVNGQ